MRISQFLPQLLCFPSIGVAVADRGQPDMPLIYVSPGFTSLTGYSEADSLGRNCRFLQADDWGQPAILEIKEGLLRRAPNTYVLRNYRRNGDPFFTALSLFDLDCEDGQLVFGIQQEFRSDTRLIQPESFRKVLPQPLEETDYLTGLHSRRALDHWLSFKSFSQNTLSVLMIDLDYFKEINDQLGHFAGDEVLKETGRVLQRIARTHGAKAYRWGGDEFALVLSGLAAHNYYAIAESISEQLKRADAPHPTSVSIGIASGAANAPQWIVEQADAQLLRAKRSGRDRICVAEESVVWPVAAAG
jgi:diguanylate cyclase (GGDEF)-like protein